MRERKIAAVKCKREKRIIDSLESEMKFSPTAKKEREDTSIASMTTSEYSIEQTSTSNHSDPGDDNWWILEY
jgi:hypothetical protein